MADARGEQLAQLIEENPDDVEGYRVYADWLEEQGDLRCQLIRMQMTRARLTDRAKLDHLETRLAEFFEAHREHFLGPLGKVLPTPKSSRQARESAPKLEWRNGFIYKAQLTRINRMPIHKFLDHMLAHPSGRFLVELGGLWAEDPAAMIAVLAARAPRSLRRLDITGTDGSRTENIAPIWPRLELLEEIAITTVAGLGDIVLPNVRRANVDVADAELLRSLATARWPKLEHLRLRIWPEQNVTADEVLAVFRNDLPALRSLELGFDDLAAGVLPPLSRLPVGAQLAELEVRIGTVEALEKCTFQLDVLRFQGVSSRDPRPLLAHIAKHIEHTH